MTKTNDFLEALRRHAEQREPVLSGACSQILLAIDDIAERFGLTKAEVAALLNGIAHEAARRAVGG